MNITIDVIVISSGLIADAVYELLQILRWRRGWWYS